MYPESLPLAKKEKYKPNSTVQCVRYSAVIFAKKLQILRRYWFWLILRIGMLIKETVYRFLSSAASCAKMYIRYIQKFNSYVVSMLLSEKMG